MCNNYLFFKITKRPAALASEPQRILHDAFY